MKNFLKNLKEPKFLFKILLLAVLYIVTAKYGLSLATSTKQVTLIWPPSGIAIAILFLFGVNLWPGVFIGALVANITSDESLGVALGISIGNTLEAVTAFVILNKLGFDRTFAKVKDVIIFVFVAGVVATMVSATIGTLSLIVGGISSWNMFWMVWNNWWIGDMAGTIVVAPAIFVWLNRVKMKFTLIGIIEGLLLGFFIVLLSVTIFTGTFAKIPYEFQVQFKYLVFPFVLWASYRFKQFGSTFAVLLVAMVGVWGAITGSGPFVADAGPERSLVFLDSFLMFLSVTFLFFSTIVQEKLRAEGEVSLNQKRFKALIENSFDAIVVIDTTGHIVYASPAVKRVLGYTPEELVGTDGFKLIYSEDIAPSKKKLAGLLTSPGKTLSIENRLYRKDGAVRWMEAEGVNLLFDESVNGIVINFRDIDERKKIDQVKTEFVSLSAHQLRTPLSSIRWYSEALANEKSLTKNSRNYVAELYKSVLNMTDTVNILLDISRFELGKVSVNSEKLDMAEVASLVVSQKKGLIDSKNIDVSLNFKKGETEMYGDKQLIKLVLENLLANSIKYSKKDGQILIGIVDLKEKIMLSVNDNGVGIPAKDREKIFTKFFRSDNVKSIASDGMGLGLYLVRLIVDLKGGKIWFESEEGKGTTFFVEFPKVSVKTK